jgi:uncharacterized protein YaaQ
MEQIYKEVKKVNRKATKRRRSAGVIAMIAAVSLIVTGTLAWRSISQRAVNNTRGVPEEPGARLHDDFLETQNFLHPAMGNKDVYVENYSGQSSVDPDEEGRPVYVRVRLSEYMEIGQGAGLFNVDPISGDPVDYQDLDRVNTGGTGRTVDTDNHADPVIEEDPDNPGTPSSILDLSTWADHIPDGNVADDGSDLHYYWEWNMGGSKIFMPTFNKDNESLLTDRTDNDLNDDGVVDEYTDGTEVVGPANYAGGVVSPADEHHFAKSTLETADVITMDEWLDLDKPLSDAANNGYWVADTDGWFYWSRSLMPTDATGLLLNGISMIHEPDNEWYYAIHVTSQMASAGDWGSNAAGAETGFYEDGITAEALDLLNRAANLAPTIRSVQIQEGRQVFVIAGESVTLHADVSVLNPTGDLNETLLTWSVDLAGNITPDGTLTTTAGDAGKIYTVTASSVALPDVQSDNIKVVVLPRDATRVVEGADGITYVDYGDNTYQKVNTNGTIEPSYRYSGVDKTIGNGDDNYAVQVNASGVKMLGPNNDDSFSWAGADNKLGTADDVKMWPDPTIDDMIAYNKATATYAVELTQVDGTGNGANNVKEFGTIKYTATVKVTNAADPNQLAKDQTVAWKLNATYKSTTKLSTTTGAYTSAGTTLTAGFNEGATIVIKATSKEGAKAQTKSVTHTRLVAGEKFKDNATTPVEWQVLTVDGSKNRLLMTTAVHNAGVQYNATND